jgi:nitrate reductase NapE component
MSKDRKLMSYYKKLPDDEKGIAIIMVLVLAAALMIILSVALKGLYLMHTENRAMRQGIHYKAAKINQ